MPGPEWHARRVNAVEAEMKVVQERGGERTRVRRAALWLRTRDGDSGTRAGVDVVSAGVHEVVDEVSDAETVLGGELVIHLAPAILVLAGVRPTTVNPCRPRRDDIDNTYRRRIEPADRNLIVRERPAGRADRG